MRQVWLGAVIILTILWAGIGTASDLSEPPVDKDNPGEYLWFKEVQEKMNVLTTTNRYPVSGKVFGVRGQMLVAITSTNTTLHINVGTGINKNWKERSLL